MKIKKKGYIQENISAVITLVVGIGVAALVMIFVSTLGGQVYNKVSDKICDLNSGGTGVVGCDDGIADDNIFLSVNHAIRSSFEAVETTGSYMPIIVLAVIISIVLTLVVGMGGGRQQYYGGSL